MEICYDLLLQGALALTPRRTGKIKKPLFYWRKPPLLNKCKKSLGGSECFRMAGISECSRHRELFSQRIFTGRYHNRFVVA
jgi:hypothetical protein